MSGFCEDCHEDFKGKFQKNQPQHIFLCEKCFNQSKYIFHNFKMNQLKSMFKSFKCNSKNGTKYLKEEIDYYNTINKTRYTIQSDQYGFNTSEERFNIITDFIDVNKLDPVNVMLRESVEQFIDFGLINYRSDKHFFNSLKRT
jgi:hypothetical protein